MPKKFKRRAPLERRRAIFHAVHSILQQKNYHDITMEEIARKAGVAKGTLFLHFRAKDQLFGAMVRDHWNNIRESWRSIIERTSSGEERIRALIHAQLEFFDHNRGLFLQVLQGTLPTGPGAPKRSELIMASVQVLSDAVADAIRAGKLRRVDSVSAGVALFGLIRGFVFATILGGLKGRLVDRTDFIWQCFYRGFRP